MNDPNTKARINLNISGELKEWITKEAKARRFNNDSEFLRFLIYQEKAKAEILDEIGGKVQEFLRSPEGMAAVRMAVRAEVQGDEVQQFIRDVVDGVLKEYVVEDD